MYQSPLMNGLGFCYHYEIILLLDDDIWLLISFADDGLEVKTSADKDILITRRANNLLIKFDCSN